MPAIQKLLLEEALEESPQTRSLLALFEKDASQLKDFVTALHSCGTRICRAQQELCSATQGISNLLKSFEHMTSPLGTDDAILTETLKEFAKHLDELSSHYQILVTQLGDSTLFPLARFLQADINDVSALGDQYKFAAKEHDASILRYSKLSKKKDSEATRAEANEDVFVNRKRFHQNALHYYTALNLLQYKRKMALLEPLIGYVQVTKRFFVNANSVVGSTDMDEFLSNISASILGVQDELQVETNKTVAAVKDLEMTAEYHYRPEPHQGMPYFPPVTNASQKSGYLFIRSRQVLSSKWDRHYFFIQAGNLMMQQREEVAGCLVLDLNEPGVSVEAAESDDRRYVFQVNAPQSKKTIILQAENDRERTEWVQTINNVIQSSDIVTGPRLIGDAVKRLSLSGEDAGRVTGSLPSPTATSSPLMVPAMDRVRDTLPPKTPPSTPNIDPSPSHMPIQFDIHPAPQGERVTMGNNGAGTPRRINPFDQSPSASGSASTLPSQCFVVRFLGCMEVNNHRGEQLIFDSIRHIMAARAINDIFKTTEYNLMVSDDSMKLINPTDYTVCTEFSLMDVSCWASHKENKRLFGFILRDRTLSGAKARFICHVFESDASGEDICLVIRVTADIAFQKLIEKKAEEKRRLEERNNPQQPPNNNPAVAMGDAPPQQQEQQPQFDAGVDLVVQLPPLDGVFIGRDQQLVDDGFNAL